MMCLVMLLCAGIFWLQLPRPLAPTIPVTPLAPVRYHLTDLGIAPLQDVDVNRVPYAALAGINHYGQIAGVTRDHTFLWTPRMPGGATGSLIDFSALFPPGTLQLNAINDDGQIVGAWQSQQAAGSAEGMSAAESQAFLWTPTVPNGAVGTIQYFPQASSAWGLNAVGQVLLADGTLWTPITPHSTHGMITLLTGLTPGVARLLLNDDGQVAGNGSLWTPTTPNGTTGTTTSFYPGDIELTSLNAYGQVLFVADANSSAYLWTPNQSHGMAGSLTQLGGLFASFRMAPDRLADDGTVAGTSIGGGFFFLLGSVQHGVVWQPTSANASSGHLLTLGGVGDDVDSSPDDLNAADAVVGRSCTKPHTTISIPFCETKPHVFVWDVRHGLHDLQPLVAAGTPYTLIDVEAIGPQGEIAALGTGSDHQPHLLLLVPQYPS
jgi:hypothetical protein